MTAPGLKFVPGRTRDVPRAPDLSASVDPRRQGQHRHSQHGKQERSIMVSAFVFLVPQDLRAGAVTSVKHRGSIGTTIVA
jgi:hypothetical protein